jgi:hypothetical protein
MAATDQEQTAPPRAAVRTSPTAGDIAGREFGARRAARSGELSQVDPWSVLKVSFVFYLCLLLVGMLALLVLWTMMNQLGIITGLLSFLEDLRLNVEIRGGNIARALFLFGLLNVIVMSAINVFLAFLYNLIADLLGGLRVSVTDDE